MESYTVYVVAPHRCPILLVRARAYQVTEQFPKELVRSDRRARAAARCRVNLAVIIFLICMLGDDRRVTRVAIVMRAHAHNNEYDTRALS